MRCCERMQMATGLKSHGPGTDEGEEKKKKGLFDIGDILRLTPYRHALLYKPTCNNFRSQLECRVEHSQTFRGQDQNLPTSSSVFLQLLLPFDLAAL